MSPRGRAQAKTRLADEPVLDPQASRYLSLRSAGTSPSEDDLERAHQSRAASLAQLQLVAGEPEPVAAVDDLVAQGTDGSARARLYRPSLEGDLPVILFVHGGGWVTGDLDTHDVVCRGLARRTGSAILAVDYRRSPEHRYPAALTDCWTCVEWLRAEGADFGLDKDRLALLGDSAGGNMAAVLARWCRDRSVPCKAQVLIYPILDVTCSSDSFKALATGYGLTAAAMRWYWQQYLGEYPPAVQSPDISPTQADDLEGLPAAMIIACEADPLHDEDTLYAERLAAARVEVRLLEQAGMVHGYFRMPAIFDRAHQSWDDCAAFLTARL